MSFIYREGAKVVWGYVDRILGQPSLIRESSRGKYPWSGFLSRATSSVLKKKTETNGLGKKGNGFGDVILNPSLQKRIQQLAGATANTKAHQAPFRNMLFYGPPGTGKTMAARELARKSVCDYTKLQLINSFLTVIASYLIVIMIPGTRLRTDDWWGCCTIRSTGSDQDTSTI